MGYHIEYIQISRNSVQKSYKYFANIVQMIGMNVYKYKKNSKQKSYKYFANIVQMIGMFSQEEDGVTIWGPARGRSPLPQQVAANFF